MNGVILYQSKYGATKKYADWISEETGFECIETKKAEIKKIQSFDVIILGGGIYASGIAGLSFLKKNMQSLRDKKIIVFCDGASPFEEEQFHLIIEHNMNEGLEEIPCYYCRGAWDMDKMSFIDRNLCKMLQKSVEKKDPKDLKVWERALLEAGEQTCDWTEKEYILPILEALK